MSNRILRTLLITLQPFFIGKLVDSVHLDPTFTTPWDIWKWVLYFIIVSMVAYLMLLLGAPESRFISKVYRSTTLFNVNYLMTLPLSWHEGAGSGNKIQQVMAAREGFKRLVELILYYYSTMFGAFLATVTAIIVLDAPLELIGLMVLFVFCFIAVATFVRRNIQEFYQKHNQIMECLSGHIYEYISAIRTTKTFALKRFISTN